MKDGAVQVAGPNSQGDKPKDSSSQVKRAPTFIEYATWKELNPYIDPAAAPPSLEIGYVHHFITRLRLTRSLDIPTGTN